MVKEYRFFTNTETAIVLRPENEEQIEQICWMLRMWALNNLGNCGTNFVVDFAEQHNIRYAYQMVV